MLSFQLVPCTHERIVGTGDQMAISTALSSPKNKIDLQAHNNSQLNMAIAELFHTENISNATVDTVRFKRVIHLSRLVGPDYKIPNRHNIGGFLLDKICERYKQGNKSRAMQDADAFGLVSEHQTSA